MDLRRLVEAGRGQSAVDVGEGARAAEVTLRLRHSDDFNLPDLGLQWFFTCAPDFTGAFWSLSDQPGAPAYPHAAGGP